MRRSFVVLAFVFAPLASATTLKVPSGSFPTIQSAANAANPNDVIVIAKGVYPEVVTFTGKQQITIRAKKGAIIDNEHTGAGLEMNGCATMTVRGLTVRDGFVNGMFFDGCADLLITKCTVQNAGGDAFAIDGGGNIRLIDNRVVTSFTGIHADANGLVIRGNRILDSVTSAMSLAGNGIIVDRNTVTHVVSSHGITVGTGTPGSAANVLIRGNRISDVSEGLAGSGISLSGVAQCTVSGNRISNVSGHGINALAGTSIVLESNRITKPGIDGMKIDSEKTTMLSNAVKKAGRNGITVTGSGDQSLLFGNRVTKSVEDGIEIDIGGDFSQVIENTGKGSGGFDFVNQGMSTEVVGNSFGTVAT